jgi:hypothetical protein
MTLALDNREARMLLPVADLATCLILELLMGAESTQDASQHESLNPD